MFVSVIITTYNRSHFLRRAIESVLNQTYRNVEIIIVDDCSTDNTKEIVEKYYSETVKYVRNKENLGPSASRNVGIKLATGRYISFLDDDDELMPEKIKKQVDLFRQNDGIDVVYCGSIKKYKDIKIENIPKFRGDIYKEALRACPNSLHSLMIKKECFEKIGFFDESFQAFGDWDLWIRLSKHYQFDFVPGFYVIYNFHGQQISVELELKISASKMILKKYFNELQESKRILFWHYRKLVSRCSLAGKYDESLKYIIFSIKTYPFNMGSYVHLLLLLTCRPLHKKLIYKFGLKKIGDIYIV